MLSLATEIKDDKSGIKRRLVEKLLAYTDIFDEKNSELLNDKAILAYRFLKAIETQDLEIIKKIIAVDKRILHTKLDGEFPLPFVAAITHPTENFKVKANIIKFLWENGADMFTVNNKSVDAKTDQGDDAFKSALNYHFWRTLRKESQDITINFIKTFPHLENIWHCGKNHKSNTLMIAAYYNKIKIVNYLLKNNADIFLENLKKQTVIDIIIAEKPQNTKVLELLRSAVFDHLVTAVRTHNYPQILHILEKFEKSIVNRNLDNGGSLLSELLEIKFIDENVENSVELFLKKGADLFIKDKSGKCPFDKIKVFNNKKLESIIQTHLQPLLKLAKLDFAELYNEKDIIEKFHHQFNKRQQKILFEIKNCESQMRDIKHIKDLKDLESIDDFRMQISCLHNVCEKLKFNPQNILESFQNLKKIATKFSQKKHDKFKNFIKEKTRHNYATYKMIADNLISAIDERIKKYQERYDSRGSEKTKNKLACANNLRFFLMQIKSASHSEDKETLKTWINSDNLNMKKQDFISAAKEGVFFGKSLSVNDQEFITQLETNLKYVKTGLNGTY